MGGSDSDFKNQKKSNASSNVNAKFWVVQGYLPVAGRW